MTLLSVPAEALRQVLPFKAEMDVRYFLNGIHIEPKPEGGCLVVATNGHVLAVHESASAHIDKPRILSISEGMKRQLREHHGETVIVKDENARATLLERNGVEVYIQAGLPFVDGCYPAWRHPIPAVHTLRPGQFALLAATYLGRLKYCLPANSHHDGVEIFASVAPKSTDHEVHAVRFESMPDLVVYIMSMRRDKPARWPAWYEATRVKLEGDNAIPPEACATGGCGE